MNFIFGGDTGQTYEQVQRRRQIADELMAQGGTPRTTGEGIASFAKQISGALIGRKADKRDDALRSEANQLWDSSMGSTFGGGGGSMPSPAPMGTAAPPVSTGPIPTEGDLLGNDAMAAIGREPNNPPASIMPASLIQTESGGNFAALNNEVGHGGVAGHGGRGQFGNARLQDAAAAGVIPPGTTPQQFAQMPPEQQIAVENWHFSDIDKAIDDVGAVGKNIGGVTMTRDALRSVAHLGGVGGMKKFVATNGEYNPADSFGTSLMDYAGTHSGGGAAPQGGQGGGQPNVSTQQIVELLSNPYIRQDPAKSAVLQSLLQQNMQGQDPMRQLEMERAQLELEQLRAGGGQDLPSGAQELAWRAEQAGLQPGTPEYQAFIINGGGDPATFRALDMTAQRAGLVPGTPEYMDWMGSRGAGDQSYARVTGENQADIATGGQAAAVVAQGGAEGTAAAASASELREMQRNLPGLMTVVDQLDELSGIATYTRGGRILDEGRKQLGLDPREGAIARAEYIAVVDNQILPLLRQTFGAAFTAQEGDTLRATLGDPDKSPEEKRAVLRAFIAQQQRNVLSRGGTIPERPQQTGDTPQPDTDGYITRPDGVRYRVIE